MSYIGSTPTTQSFIAGTDYFNGNGSTVNFTLSRSVNSVNDIEVIVNNVEQIPSGYSVSGTTLTFSAAPSAGTSNVYVRYLSTTNLSLAIPSGTSATFNTVTVADGSATTPSITNDGDTNTGIFFPAADTIAFAEGGVESMRIDSSGNVGIGTTSPTEKLTVSGAVIATSIATSTARDATIVDYQSGVASRFIAGRAGGNYGQWEAHVAGASGITKRYQIDYQSIHSWYAADGTTERARITSAGDFMVGTTVEPTGSTGGSAFMVSSVGRRVLIMATTITSSAGLTEFKNPNGRVGGITVSGSSTSYDTSSDYRLKEAIAPMTGALAKVALLKPCTYKWKVDGSDGQGFIAHELDEVVSGCVTGAKDAVDADGNPQYQGIDTSFLVATLTAAIQEQQALITALTTRITALENNNATQ